MRLSPSVPILVCCLLLIASVRSSGQRPPPANHDSTLAAIRTLRPDSARLSVLLNYAQRLAPSYPAEAISLERRVLEEAEHTGPATIAINAGLDLGDMYAANADYPRALSYYHDALEQARQTGNHKAEVTALGQQSVIYLQTHDLPRSVLYLRMADSIARYNRLWERLPGIITEIGIRYDEAQQYDSAVSAYKESAALARQLNMPAYEITARVNMAVAFKKQHRFPEALHIYKESFSLIRDDSDWTKKTIILDNLANLYYEMGEPDSSKYYAAAALQGLSHMHTDRLMTDQDVQKLLVKIYKQEQDWQRAFAAGERLAAIKDTLFNEQKVRQVQEAGVRFDTELKDSRIAAQQAEIRHRKRLTLFLSIGLILLLASGTSIFISQFRRRRLARLLLLQKEELEQLNSVKDRIFSAISHDIRTPLSSLFSFSRLLSEGNIDPEKLPRYTAQLNSQLSYTVGLMDNLLHWAHSQMRGFHAVLQTLYIGDLTANIPSSTPEAAQKGIRIVLNVPPGIRAYADREMSALILRNLLQNAVKYTAGSGTITVEAKDEGDTVRLSVADTGIGLDAAMIAAFNTRPEPMTSRPGTAGEKGTGIGLMLCKSLAAAMGGRIELCEVAAGGACFSLVLPAAADTGL